MHTGAYGQPVMKTRSLKGQPQAPGVLIPMYVVSDLRKVCSNAKSEAITSLVVDWISANNRPISAVVEDTGLRQLFGYIEPTYSLPSRTQVTSIVKNIMQVARKV